MVEVLGTAQGRVNRLFIVCYILRGMPPSSGPFYQCS
jgi:hypothetical protein